jgi:hypothetical protein
VESLALAGTFDARYPLRGIFFGCCADADAQSARSMVVRATKKILLLIIGLFTLTLSLAGDSEPFDTLRANGQ